MAKYVREIMNPELFSVEPEAARQDTLDFLLLLGVTACPVIDEAGKLIGMVSIRDLIAEEGGGRTRDRISEPAVSILQDATVTEAAKKLSEHHAHRLVVIDEKGRAAGIVSAVDLVAALVGLPVEHPHTFPHLDSEGQGTWSDDLVLDADNGERVPNEPGVLVLIYGGAGHEELPVWVSEVNNLRATFDGLAAGAPPDDATLAHIVRADYGHLRARVAPVADPERRRALVDEVQRKVRSRLWARA